MALSARHRTVGPMTVNPWQDLARKGLLTPGNGSGKPLRDLLTEETRQGLLDSLERPRRPASSSATTGASGPTGGSLRPRRSPAAPAGPRQPEERPAASRGPAPPAATGAARRAVRWPRGERRGRVPVPAGPRPRGVGVGARRPPCADLRRLEERPFAGLWLLPCTCDIRLGRLQEPGPFLVPALLELLGDL